MALPVYFSEGLNRGGGKLCVWISFISKTIVPFFFFFKTFNFSLKYTVKPV